MSRPRKNLAESVLARAELFRRGMMFGGVPSFANDMEMPAPPAVASPEASPGAADPSQAGPAVPGAGEALADGAVNNQSPLQTLMTPSQ
jgi:hypothetical protein